MLVVVNGEPREAAAGCTIAQLLDALGVAGRIAVEVNDEVVPRSERAARHLRDGDRIEIVRAIGGG
ncbi:MAG: sulfur carrier protein ThiS [Gammaproteobacteria bacterium]|nr:sulfur carrier protein ThiS [Gammaproteobacteria bacterium]